MTPLKNLRMNATLSLVCALVAAGCFAFDVYLMIVRHGVNDRLSWDIAYLILYGGGVFVFSMRYRHYSALMVGQDGAVDSGASSN